MRKCRQTGNNIGRTVCIAVILLMGLFTMTGTVQAKEETIVSGGSLIYEDNRGRMEWFAEDLVLLREKLSSVSGQCYEPSCYTHDHNWVYRDINDKTHTRHCDGCGNAYDLINSHTASQEESCVISYGEKTYQGLQYVCECGRQWMLETGHTLLFEPVDAISHRSRCALEGTAYCQGYESVLEEHYAYSYVRNEDGAHHKKICLDCGYQEEESCSFTLESPGSDEEEPDTKEDVRWCVCGNCVKQENAGEEPAQPTLGEPPKEPEKPVEEGEKTETPVDEEEKPETPAEGEAEPEKPVEEEEKPETPAEEEEKPETPVEEEEKPETPAEGEAKPGTPTEGEEKTGTPAEGEEKPETPAEERKAGNVCGRGGSMSAANVCGIRKNQGGKLT